MEKPSTILIIEESPELSEKLGKTVSRAGVGPCRNAAPGSTIEELERLEPDLAVVGPGLGTVESFRCIHKLRILNPSVPILLFCGKDFRGEPDAVALEGVFCVGSDPGSREMPEVLDRALREAVGHRAQADLPLIIGQSREMIRVRRKIRNVSSRDITILITGETGTGKDLIARAVHYLSPRRNGPLVKINCGALPDELLESEVFGFQRGAFTGAHRDKPGRLEMANGGTLFIDEIGDLSLSLQVKFLQVLEDSSFSRLGGTRDKAVDTRVVAATNSDLRKRVRNGTFRKDLFYRLNVMHIVAPPLRERREDIPLLTDYFLNKYCFEFKKEMLDVPGDVADLFFRYSWPGNVRELENVVRRAIVLRDWGFVFGELDVEKTVVAGDDPFQEGPEEAPYRPDDLRMAELFQDHDFSLKKATKAFVSGAERRAILKSLERTRWNRKEAARLLGVSYKTLLNRIREFGLRP